MTVAFRAAGPNANTAGATTLAVVAPSCQAGDLLILAVTVSTATAQTFGGLTGWTQQKNLNVNSPVLAVFTKFAVAADSGATFNPTWTTSVGAEGVIVAYSGVDSVVGPIDASSSGNSTTSTCNYGTANAVLNNMAVSIGAMLAGGVSTNVPSGWTSRVNIASGPDLSIGDKAFTVGSTGAITSAGSGTSNNQGVLLMLRPAQVPTFRGTGAAVQTTGTSINQAPPATAQIGDLLIAMCSAVSGSTVWNVPAGWTQVGTQQNGNAVFYRTAAVAGAVNNTFTISTASTNLSVITIAYSGVSSVVGATAALAGATAAVSPTVTSTAAGSTLVTGAFGSNTAPTSTPPAGMTEQGDFQPGATAFFAWEDEGVGASGTVTGTRTATLTGASTGITFSLLLAPPTSVPIVRGAARSTAANPSLSITVTLPPNAQNGDTVIIVATVLGVSPQTVTDPAGWTPIQSDGLTSGVVLRAYSKTIGPSEPNPVVAWTANATGAALAVALVSGVVDVDGDTITATSTTITFPTVTPTRNGETALFFAFDNVSSGTGPTMPAGSVTWESDASTANTGLSIEMIPTTAATGSRTATANSGNNVGYVVTLAGGSAPSADTLTSPTNGSYTDVSGGVTFQSTYNSTDAANANAYALRAKQAGGSYVYWNAGSSLWQGTIVWNALSTAPGATRSVAVPASATIANGFTLNWSIASQESLANLQGPFASDFTIVMQAAPVLSVTAPTGTIGTLTPTVTWTTTPGAGATQTAYRVVVYNPTQYGGGGFTPGVTAGDYDSGVLSGAASSLSIPAGILVAGLAYRFYVQVTETGGETSSWQFTTSTITLDPPADPTITATPGTDGTTGAPRTAVTVQGRDNLMSTAAASFEDGTTGGWVAGASTTIANSSAQALNGTKSLALTRITSIGTASASTPTGAAGFACTPGQTVTAIVNFRAAATGRTCSFQILWYKAGGAASTVRASDTSGNVSDVTTGWTAATLTVVAPSDAVTFAIVANAGNGAAAINEVHYIDAIDLGPGASTTWTRGGLSGLTTAIVQFSDDGVTWTNLRTSGATIPWPAQAVTVYDYEAPPGAVRQYRAQVQANIGSIIASNIVTTTATGTTPTQWVLSDPTDPTSGLLFHATSAPQRSLVEHEAIHAPLGRAKQVRVSDGPKGWAGRLQVRTLTTAAQSALEALLARDVVLLIQSPEGGGRQWYANINTDPTVQQNERTLGVNVRDGVAGRGTTRMPHTDTTLAYAEAERP